MRRRSVQAVLGLLFWWICSLGVAGASRGEAELQHGPRPVVVASGLSERPTIDGDVIGDPAWRSVEPATGFVQNTPDEGETASERTEVFVAFHEGTLLLGVVCYDGDPGTIIVADSRRDTSLNETDSFQVILDTYSDGQSGFVFGTNPAGIEFDGQVAAAASGGLSAGNRFNRNWDGAWEVEARISEIGWSAEFAIPFRTLRFPRQSDRPWGINFQRNIRRRNERSFWAPLPRQFNLYWVALAGRLEGLQTPSQRTLQLIPYGLAEGRRGGEAGEGTRTVQDAGLDLKYGLTPSLTLDATLNTDFAQVEVDEQQINLDRFNLFFPEKRPFFLENADLFSVGVPEEIELFFSRRIGLGPDGEEIPIDGGLRISGKAGSNNLGFLVMRAEAMAGVAPENDFLVARYSRDLPRRSSLGAIFVGRDGSGELAPGLDENRTYGVDGRWGIGEGGQLLGFYARTDSPGLDGRDHAYRLGGRFDTEAWSGSLFYSEVGEDFNPEVGFLRRSGYRKPEGFLLRRWRPERLWGLHELRPHISYRGFWDFDGFQETGHLHVDNHWEWRNGYEVHTGINFTHEGVAEAFEIFEGVKVPAGTYEHEEAQIVFYTNQGAPASLSLRLVAGGFFGGERLALRPTFRFRLAERFNASLAWRHNDIDLPGGEFETNLGRLRLSYSFTTRMFLQALVQYNDAGDEWASNLRFGWQDDANTGLFIVYNEIREIGSASSGLPDRALIVKYSRLIDLLR